MTEMDVLISAFVGGALAASAMSLIFWAQIRWAYDEKLKALQYQLMALRIELNSGYTE